MLFSIGMVDSDRQVPAPGAQAWAIDLSDTCGPHYVVLRCFESDARATLIEHFLESVLSQVPRKRGVSSMTPPRNTSGWSGEPRRALRGLSARLDHRQAGPGTELPVAAEGVRAKGCRAGWKRGRRLHRPESGAKADRPGWTSLAHEARDRENRRFDLLLIYDTSRLARDRFLAALYERELRKVDVAIVYATGAGDSSTPEGQLMIGMRQLWDAFERAKLGRETRRGMREAAEQGFRTGGRAPYGYRRVREPLPDAASRRPLQVPRHARARP
jgi:hypothetical protein